MKKIHLGLTALAFCGAIIGAFGSKANANIILDVYGHTSTGVCVWRPLTIQLGCSIYGTGPQCTVFVPGSILTGPNQIAPAYSNSNCNYSLHMP